LAAWSTRCARLLLFFLFRLLAFGLRPVLAVLVIPAVVALGLDGVAQSEGRQQAESCGPERSQHVAPVARAGEDRRRRIEGRFVLHLVRHSQLSSNQVSPWHSFANEPDSRSHPNTARARRGCTVLPPVTWTAVFTVDAGLHLNYGI
jgi:hypothetical protein